MESMNGEIYDNDISDCRIGIRLSMGSAGNVVHDNLFDGFSESEATENRGPVKTATAGCGRVHNTLTSSTIAETFLN